MAKKETMHQKIDRLEKEILMKNEHYQPNWLKYKIVILKTHLIVNNY